MTTAVPRADLGDQSSSWSERRFGGSGERQAMFVAAEVASKLGKAGTNSPHMEMYSGQAVAQEESSQHCCIFNNFVLQALFFAGGSCLTFEVSLIISVAILWRYVAKI